MTAKTKLAHFVADFVARQGVRHVFAISGGASLHLIHAIADHPEIDYITPHHEQAAAMAADGYARVTGGLGVAMATSGPGATNLITGIACSYYDSIPTLFITGQVSTFRMVGDTGVRQIGFQETPIVEMCQNITKYAVQIKDPNMIRYELEKAVHIAKDGRPGPVLVDIPDDFQRTMIDVKALKEFTPSTLPQENIRIASHRDSFLTLLKEAERPVIILGWGVHMSDAEAETIAFAQALDIPVALTWGAADILPSDHPLYIGTFGTHGMRHVNFAVQNADLILSLGARLDTKATGTPVNTFARGAKKIVVDIDAAELGKFTNFGLNIDILIQSDVKKFINGFSSDMLRSHANFSQWHQRIASWKSMFASLDNAQSKLVLDPYTMIDHLSEALPRQANLFIDTGCAIAWAMQRLKLREHQRIFHDFNNTAMGWALPAAIGGYFANPNLPPILLVGDGSLMMSLYELATVKHHRIPLKLLLINNSGYAMIQQTQDQWLGSHYHASSREGGLSFPNYALLAQTFDMEYFEISHHSNCLETMQEVMHSTSPSLCNIIVPSEARVIPQVKFGRPNEDMEPLLSRDMFLDQMIVDALEVSKA